jgi:terminase small subunit-like protein
MPGTPKLEKLYADIEEQGGLDSVFDALADGALVRELAAKFGVSRGWFGWALKRTPELRKRWEEAIAARANAMAEDAIDIADNAPETPAGVQKAKLRAELRQWLAATDNARYRRAQAPLVHVTIGELHLDALRLRPPNMAPPALPTEARPTALPPAEAEYEVVEEP